MVEWLTFRIEIYAPEPDVLSVVSVGSLGPWESARAESEALPGSGFLLLARLSCTLHTLCYLQLRQENKDQHKINLMHFKQEIFRNK